MCAYSLTCIFSSYILEYITTQPCVSLASFFDSLHKKWERRKPGNVCQKKWLTFQHVIIHVINTGHSHFSNKLPCDLGTNYLIYSWKTVRLVDEQVIQRWYSWPSPPN